MKFQSLQAAKACAIGHKHPSSLHSSLPSLTSALSPKPISSPRSSPRRTASMSSRACVAGPISCATCSSAAESKPTDYVLTLWKDKLKLFSSDAAGSEGAAALAADREISPKTERSLPPPHPFRMDTSVGRQRLEDVIRKKRPAVSNPPSSEGKEEQHAKLFMPGSCLEPAIAPGRLVKQFFLKNGLTDEQIVGQLAKIEWFHSMSLAELHELNQRSHHKFTPRYTTIFREGNLGDTFYVLLQGLVHCTSAKSGLDVTRGVGATFDEGALVMKVRRDVTAVALEHCYFLQLDTQQAYSMRLDLLQAQPHLPHHRLVAAISTLTLSSLRYELPG